MKLVVALARAAWLLAALAQGTAVAAGNAVRAVPNALTFQAGGRTITFEFGTFHRPISPVRVNETSLIYREVYPRLDLVLHAGGDRIEYDWIAHPGARLSDIRMRCAGCIATRERDGGLTLRRSGAAIHQDAPVSYLRDSGWAMRSSFALYGDGEFGFAVPDWDGQSTLVIDPVLNVSSYWGGTGSDVVTGSATDSSGNLYLAGYTTSLDLPVTSGAFQTTATSCNCPHGFVVKLSPTGAVVYATYVGGSGYDRINAIAVDAAGSAYVAGVTQSTNFPTTAGAYRQQKSGSDAFVAKLSPSGGSLVYGTTLAQGAIAEAIAIGPGGAAYVAGEVASGFSFPTTVGAYQTTARGGAHDVFLAVLNAAGSSLTTATLLGGSGDDTASGLVVDSTGQATVAGSTAAASGNTFPTTGGAFQTTPGGDRDGFVTKFNAALSGLVFSTYFGGAQADAINALTADSAGNFYVTGATGSLDFPLSGSPYLSTPAFGFVAKLSGTGALFYSTYFGYYADYCNDPSATFRCGGGNSIVADNAGNAWIAGSSSNAGFVVTSDALQKSNGGGSDAFLLELSPAGNAVLYATLLGGGGDDYGSSLALSAQGTLFLAGSSLSGNFPVFGSAPQRQLRGQSDVTYSALSLAPLVCSYALSAASAQVGQAASTYSLTLTAPYGCTWTAQSDSTWATVGSGGSGNGTGTISINVAANNSGLTRSAVITAGGQAFTLTQSGLGCVATATPPSLSFGALGGSTTVQLGIAGGCAWTASSTAAWLRITSAASGTGPASIAVVADVNTTSAGRSATLQLAGLSIGVSEAGLNCSATLSPSTVSVPGSGGATSVTLSIANGCPWTATASAPWLTITSGASGTGPVTISLSAAANPANAPRSTSLIVAGLSATINQTAATCIARVSPSRLQLPANGGSGTVQVTIPDGCSWTASSPVPWVTVTPTSAVNSGTVTYAAPSFTSSASRYVYLTIAGAQVSFLQVTAVPDVTKPFGSYDTPIDGTTDVAGSIGVTGWALDNVGVTRVDIWREPLKGEPVAPNGLVYIGIADFVKGTRPDVQRAFQDGYWNNIDRSGWGYLMLTNTLPNQGNGTFRFHAIAQDAAGNLTDLGVKSITCTNATSVIPFGAIDTPGQGGTVSGTSYIVNGWALTAAPATIPLDGSTVLLYVDSKPLGNPIYGFFRSDIASIFPNYPNALTGSAYYVLDTTVFADGIHSIEWSATDTRGNTGGIGSRYFYVQNGPNPSLTIASGGGEELAPQAWVELPKVDADQLARVELQLPFAAKSWRSNGSTVGASLSDDGRTFYWHLGAPYLGSFDLEFLPDREGDPGARVRIDVRPRRRHKLGPVDW